MTTSHELRNGYIGDDLNDRYACLICGEPVWEGSWREHQEQQKQREIEQGVPEDLRFQFSDDPEWSDFALVGGQQPTGVYITFCDDCLFGTFDPSGTDAEPTGIETHALIAERMRQVLDALRKERRES